MDFYDLKVGKGRVKMKIQKGTPKKLSEAIENGLADTDGMMIRVCVIDYLSQHVSILIGRINQGNDPKKSIDEFWQKIKAA